MVSPRLSQISDQENHLCFRSACTVCIGFIIDRILELSYCTGVDSRNIYLCAVHLQCQSEKELRRGARVVID